MRRPRWPTWGTPLSLFILALAIRLAFLGTRPYGDEAHHYYIARHFGDGPDNVYGFMDGRWLFWWRPLFSLLLAPGAQFGFTGFRVAYIALVALLAPALWWWLRARGVSNGASVVGGILVAVHPALVVWGVRAFPDELMATAFVAGLALWERSRHRSAAMMFLAATWIKEVALVGVGVILAQELVAGVQRDGRDLTVRLGLRHALLVAVLAFAYLPHLYAETLGGRPPGWSRGGNLLGVLDGAFTSLWFVPFVVAALFWRPSRRPAALALTYLGFFAIYTVVLGGRAEQWYYVLPTVLAIAAVVAWLDALVRDVRPRFRSLARPLAAFALALVLIQAVVPATIAAKQPILHPGIEGIDLSVLELARAEYVRDQDLWATLAQMQGDDWENVLLVDVAWFFAVWPFSDRAGFVASAYTDGSEPNEVWSIAIEDIANTTIIRRGLTPLSLALGDVYGDCIQDTSAEYVLLRGQGCKGRLPQLRAAFEAHRMRAAT